VTTRAGKTVEDEDDDEDENDYQRRLSYSVLAPSLAEDGKTLGIYAILLHANSGCSRFSLLVHWRL
jgi:hypothetical protein